MILANSVNVLEANIQWVNSSFLSEFLLRRQKDSKKATCIFVVDKSRCNMRERLHMKYRFSARWIWLEAVTDQNTFQVSQKLKVKITRKKVWGIDIVKPCYEEE